MAGPDANADQLRLIGAAMELVQETGSAEFTLRELAFRAGLPAAASFSHFSSPGHVVIGMISAGLDVQRAILATLSDLPPLDQIFAFGYEAARMMIENAAVSRPVTRAMGSIRNQISVDHLEHNGRQVWRLALGPAHDAGYFHDTVDLDAMARLLHLQFRGHMMDWAAGEIDGEQWTAELNLAIALVLRGAVIDQHEPALERKVLAAQHSLADLDGTGAISDDAHLRSVPDPAPGDGGEQQTDPQR